MDTTMSTLANKNIFCNAPWYELHIYWDGSLGICCQEAHKLYNDDRKEFNIKTMSIMDWFNSSPARQFRSKLLGDKLASECSRCYIEEKYNGNSRRFRENQKSVIFMKGPFEPSFLQSPGYKHFKHSADNDGHTHTYPIDIHVDLGNFCNLACKMCNSKASSTIASQNVIWGKIEDKQFLGQDWTRDQAAWDSFKTQLLDIPGLNNIHFMGGETLLTDKFEDFVDTMIAHKKFDLSFSFVSNGTVFNPTLIDKLKKFRRVGFEISIETLDSRNSYIRQGTDTAQVLTNINRYLEQCNNSSVTLSLRPAPSLLSIGGYHTLLKFALENKLVVKSNLCYDPKFLNINMLPADVKKIYLEDYVKLLDISNVNLHDYNESDPNNYSFIVNDHIRMCIGLLSSPTPDDSEHQLQHLVDHCRRWDAVYKLNAREIYPELTSIWDKYGY